MDLKKSSISTQSKITNQTLKYLMKEDNFKELEKTDKDKILAIKRNLDDNFKLNLLLITASYGFTNYFLIRKIKFRTLKRLLDLSVIIGTAYLGSIYCCGNNIQKNSKDLNNLRKKYSLLIKNTISTYNEKENKEFNQLDIHTKYSYSYLNFLFLLLVRLFF